jgi:dephospho-CoA kinase
VVIDADQLAREVVEPGMPALAEIEAEFGPTVLDARAGLDRAALATIVFADAEQRRRLEAITHPRIGALMAERVTAALATSAPLVVLEIPLLFEGSRETTVEGVLVVWCDPATQAARLRARDGLTEEETHARLAAQLPIDEKRRRATWVIDNSGSPESTAAQVERWWVETLA